MYSIIRSLLFQLDAERSHDTALNALAFTSRAAILSGLTSRALGGGKYLSPVEAMGIKFPNPVGLAPGLDKDAIACNALHRLGFGWLELGTVTPDPQPGNPKPRMFRLPEHQAIINRMGFNSAGLNRFIENIKKASPKIIKGINIGKNASTPMAKALDDYIRGLRQVYGYADYVAINISSPNTKNLRDLQQEEMLNTLLHRLNNERETLSDRYGRKVPLVLKISPDISSPQVDAVSNLLRKYSIDGVAATNTTVSRNSIKGHPCANEVGGLSGSPLSAISTEIIAMLSKNLQGEIPIIGVGGIVDGASAREKLNAGAKLIQLYTGFIFHGPKLIREIFEMLKG